MKERHSESTPHPAIAIDTFDVFDEYSRRLGRDTVTCGDEYWKILYAGALPALRSQIAKAVTRPLLIQLRHEARSVSTRAASAEAAYERFVTSYDSSAKARLFRTFPALEIYLDTVGQNWLDATREAMERIGRDSDSLWVRRHVSGELRTASFGAGDPHRGGRSVVLLHYESGSLVYKPRDLSVDRVMRALARELAGHVPVLERCVPDVLPRDGYGYAAYVSRTPAQDHAEVREYYANMGRVLAFAQLAKLNDIHFENIIPVADVPVVVDWETLFHPDRPIERGDGWSRAAHAITVSPTRSGILPNREPIASGAGADLSSFAAIPGEQPAKELPMIADGRSSNARVVIESVPHPPSADHLPMDDTNPLDFTEDLLRGYREARSRLEDPEVSETCSALIERMPPTVRVVVRATADYAKTLSASLHPTVLHSVDQRRSFLRDALEPRWDDPWLTPELVREEVQALLSGDIPCFDVSAAGGHPESSGAAIEDLVLPPFRLDPSKSFDNRLEVDSWIVESSLTAATLASAENYSVDRERDARDFRAADVATEDVLGALCSGIMSHLSATAHKGDDRSVAWLTVRNSGMSWDLDITLADLFSGAAGIMVAAAAARAANIALAPAEDLLERCLQSIRHACREKWLTPRGGHGGVGGVIWAATAVARLLPGTADEMAGLIDELLADERMSADDTYYRGDYDVVGGAAGTLLGLSAAARHHGFANDRRVEKAATVAVEHLVTTAEWRERTCAWHVDFLPEPLGGVAHGVSGVALALARSRELLSPGLRVLADNMIRGSLAYEESLFIPALGNWRDVRSGIEELRVPDGSRLSAWCHGALGIVAAWRELAAEGFGVAADQLQQGVGYAVANPWIKDDSLCHGLGGAFSVLRRLLAQDDPIAGVEPHCAELARLLEHRAGAGVVCGIARGVQAPGLMTGLAGIAFVAAAARQGSEALEWPDPLMLG